jgi:Tfp pilus assembly protein PilN
MTVDIPTRPAEQQAPEPPRRGLRGGPQINIGRPRTVGKAPLVVGGQPRANLLPPEIVLKRTQLKTRRGLRVGVFFVFVATVVACAGVWGIASVSQVQLEQAQAQQAALVNEQVKFDEVRNLQTTIKTITAGQQVGGSTEINWRDYLTLLQASLPAGVVLNAVSIESGTPMVAYAPSDVPLQGDRVAGLTFTATGPTLPSFPDWLRSLAKLPGFVDATPGSVKQGAEGGYTAQILMHINTDAFSLRFDPEHIKQAEADAAEAAAAADAAGSDDAASGQSTGTDAEAPATDDQTDDEGGN